MYSRLSVRQTLKALKSSKSKGLSQKRVSRLLKSVGKNTLPEKKQSKLKLFLSQFNNFIIYILLFALVISLIIPFLEGTTSSKNFLDAYAIAAILILNAALGFFQEYKAQKSVELLKNLSSPKSLVLRDKKKMLISSKNLVPGDIVFIEAGSKISADGRLIKSVNLKVNESSLTGESTPIKKSAKTLKEEMHLAERKNMVFSGTIVTEGKGTYIVTATGKNTEIGKIASLVQETKRPKTPLEKKLENLGKFIGLIVLSVCAFIFFFGLIKGFDLFEMFLFAISLAVASVPEGLPAVVTVSLGLGVIKLLKKNTLVKKIKAIETLGNITVICSDKTGTITQNNMKVTKVFVNNKLLSAKKVKKENTSYLLNICASCNDASLPDLGDPTDLALLSFAKKFNINKLKRVSEIPFSSTKKYMQTTHKINNKKISFIKGAPEKIVEMSNFYEFNKKISEFDKKSKDNILKKNSQLASKALRVIGCAYKLNDKVIFLGLVAMMDPPRPGVKKSIGLCKKAGIRTIMITGDNAKTAEAIAKKVGIPEDVIDGDHLDQLTDEDLYKLVDNVSVFARVSPNHKVRILKALQHNGEVVSMTGDGVNDSPALKKADAGIAMGIAGTDICKDTADFVLTDDNFSSIVTAVHQGRIIYDNIKKFVKFLFAANFGEILVILFAFFLLSGREEFILPLFPLHILWINLVTDSFPALALSAEKGEPDIMKRKPSSVNEPILKGSLGFVFFSGVLAAFSVLFLFFAYLPRGVILARTVGLTCIIFFQLFLVFSARSDKSILKIGFFSNKLVIYGVLAAVVMHLIVLYSSLNSVFGLTPLSVSDWARILPVSLLGFFFFEIKKLLTKS